jgi:hypothetical protein
LNALSWHLRPRFGSEIENNCDWMQTKSHIN